MTSRFLERDRAKPMLKKRNSLVKKRTDIVGTQHFMSPPFDASAWIPTEVGKITNHQTDLPRIAKDKRITAAIEANLTKIPTIHNLYKRDARDISFIPDESVHLVLTSPPYWTLKTYRDIEGQLGHVSNYTDFICQLDEVWTHCFRTLVPGGRLVCAVTEGKSFSLHRSSWALSSLPAKAPGA